MSVQAQISGDIKIRDLEGGLYAEGGIVTSKPFGEANGFATLGGDGKVPSSQLPSYVDDVVEVANYAALPIPGETGKIYITLDTNYVYRWAGSTYVQIIDTSAVWGAITGTLSNQTDLQNALDAKVPYTGATGNVDLGTYGIKADYSQFNLTPSSVPTTVGTLSWDSFYRTLQLVDGDGDTTLQIGQEQRTLVHNNTGSTLTDGQVVYVTGSTGELPSVALASNTSETTSSVTFGVVTESIANGANGFITTSGIVHGLNTLAFNEGDALWLGSTAGTFTNVKPVAPANSVLIGYVIKKAGGNGSIFVKIQNGYELEELHDVLITSVANNQGIFWDSATSLWKNKSIPTALGYTPLAGDGVAGRIPYYTGTTTLGNEAAFNYDANTNRLGVNTNTPNATIGANAGTDSGYSLLLKNADTNYNGLGFGVSSVYGHTIETIKLGTALSRNLTLFNQSGYLSLTEDGNLGLGILNPSTGLDIYNGTSSYLWLHTATSGLGATNGVRLALFNTNTANLRNFEGAFSITAEGNFSVITLGAENLRVESSTGKVGIGNPASVPEMLTVNGSIQQSSVTSALLKTDLNGKLIPAVAGSDYLTPSAISGALNTVVKFTSPTQIGNSNITDDGSTITLGSKTFVANGNLGVGTSNPAVSGVGIDIYSATNTGLRFHNAASGTTVSDGAGINFSSGLNLGITNYEAGTIDIVTNGNSGVFIASNGYVGINGAVGGYPLDVIGSIKQTTVTSSMLKADASGVLVAAVAGTDYQAPLSNIVTGFSAANNVALWSGTTTLTGTSNLWYNSASNFLGIGTNNPQRRLTIFNATLDSQVQISGGAPSVALTEAVTGGIYQAKFAMATAAGHYVSGAVAGDFVLLSQTGATIFATSSTEKMRINTSGRLLLGTTTDNGSLLQVAGSATFVASGTYTNFLIGTTSTTGAIIADANRSNLVLGASTSNKIVFNNASTTQNGYIYSDSAELSLGYPASGTFNIQKVGVGNVFTVNSSGNVGIGTSSPAAKLHVYDAVPSGATKISITNTSSAIYSSSSLELISHNGTSPSVGTVLFHTSNNFTYGGISPNQTNLYGVRSGGIRIVAEVAPIIFANGNSDLDFASERMRITSGGNVQITNSNPTLDFVTNTTATTTMFSIVGAQYVGSAPYNSNILRANNSSNIAFEAGGSERMRITSGGQVQIGSIANSAGYGLEVYGSNQRIVCQDNANGTAGVYFRVLNGGTMVGNVTLRTDNAGNFSVFTGTSSEGERMRITSGGNVLVGTTTGTLIASTLFQVGASGGGGQINISGGYTPDAALNVRDVGNNLISFFYGGTKVGSVTTNGSTTSYNITSDYRLKEDFKEIKGLDKVLSIKVYDFKWKDNDARMYGAIAHELQEVIPYAVTGEKDGEILQQVDYSKIVPVNTKAIQELYQLVLAQQQQIEELKQLILNK